jgi:hydrogenase 3 maturation protease
VVHVDGSESNILQMNKGEDLAKDTVIMCIGNRDGGDDAIGPYIADLLKKEQHDFMVLDCGTAPENYTSVVKRCHPKTLVFIDAAEMGLPAGEIRIVPKEKIGTMHLSTHGISIALLIKFLEKDLAEIIVVGIQPENMSGPMSTCVQKSGEQIIDILKKKNISHISVL